MKKEFVLIRRVLLLTIAALLSVACGNVGTVTPTPAPQPVEIQAEVIPPHDVLLTIKNNAAEPLALGGWTMQVAPVDNPSLVPPATIPAGFSIAAGQSARVHTLGGQNTATTLFLDTTSSVPADAWGKGTLVELRDPKSDKSIKRYIYGYTMNSGK